MRWPVLPGGLLMVAWISDWMPALAFLFLTGLLCGLVLTGLLIVRWWKPVLIAAGTCWMVWIAWNMSRVLVDGLMEIRQAF